MNNLKCKIHPTSSIILERHGPHIGAYCATCHKWLKWLNAKELLCYDISDIATMPIEATNDVKNYDIVFSDDDDVPW